ncbi:hypothetical protein ACT7DB_33385 [Bacillus cereus]
MKKRLLNKNLSWASAQEINTIRILLKNGGYKDGKVSSRSGSNETYKALVEVEIPEDANSDDFKGWLRKKWS